MKLLDLVPRVGLHDWDVFLADRVAAVRAAQERELRDRIDEEGCCAVVAALRFGGPAGCA
ncbi:MAG: hypothetical protein WCY29_05865 [Novosphingobium sp.]